MKKTLLFIFISCLTISALPTLCASASTGSAIKEFRNTYDLFKQVFLAKRLGEAEEQLNAAERIFDRLSPEAKAQLSAQIFTDEITAQTGGLMPSQKPFFTAARKLIESLQAKNTPILSTAATPSNQAAAPQRLTRQQRLAAAQLSEADRKELEKIKEEVQEKKDQGWNISVLDKVVQSENLKLLEWLLATQEGRALCNIHERTTCHSDFFHAVQGGNKSITDLFVKYGTNVNFVDENGDAYIHQAVLNQDTDALKELIRLRADINKKNAGGMTPLCLAAATENADAAKILIKAGALCDDDEHQEF